MQGPRTTGAILILLGLLAAGCGKQQDVLVTRIDRVYAPSQVLHSDQRLAADTPTGVPIAEGQMFLVISTTIKNTSTHQQALDQNKVELLGRYSNDFARIGLTVDCSDSPSVMEYDGKLDTLQLKPGETLRGDPQTTCFVFAVPTSDAPFRLKLPGAPDVPVPMPPRKLDASAPASGAPSAAGAAPASSAGVS